MYALLKKILDPPLLQFDSGDIIDDITEKPTSGHFELVYFHSFGLFKLGNYAGAEEREPHPNSDKES